MGECGGVVNKCICANSDRSRRNGGRLRCKAALCILIVSNYGKEKIILSVCWWNFLLHFIVTASDEVYPA